MAVDVGTAYGYLELDISGFSGNLKQANAEFNSTVKGMQDNAGNMNKNIGDTLTRVGTGMTIGLTVPLVAAGKQMWTTASEFEAAMSQVGAITGTTGTEFDALRDKAVQLGQDTVFSSSEVADAMVEMGKAGWNSQQIIAGMEGVLDAASASGENLSTVSTIMADAMTTFGISAEDATHVADVLTQTANAGTIDISDLGESFKYIGPSAAAAGFSFEDVNTALLAMSQSGIKASQAGTSLRGLFVNLVKPTDQMKQAMDELGIEITNSDGTFKSLDDIIAQLRTSMSGMTDEQKAYYSSILAGKTGLSGLMSLLNVSQEEYDELAASIDNCGGVADETASIMQDNLKNDVEQLTGSLESMAITLMKNLEPFLRKVVQALEDAVNWFTNLDPTVQTVVVAILALVAALGPALVIIGGILNGAQQLNMAFGSITKAFQALADIPSLLGGIGKAASTAFSAITSPIGIAVALIAALVGAFIYLWNTSEEFRANIIETFNRVVEAVTNFVSGVGERLAEVGITFESVTSTIMAIWDAFCQFLAPIFEGAFAQIATILETVFGIITGLLDIFIGLFTGNWDQFWQGISEVFGAIWNGIVGTLTNVWNTIVGVVGVFLSMLGTNISGVLTGIANFFVGIWNGIVTTVQTVWNTIVTVITTVLNTIWTTITTIWNTIWTTITTVMNNIWTTIQNVWNTILTTITTVMNNIWNTIQNVWNTIVSTVTTIVNNIWNTITSIFNNILSTISSVMSSIWNTIQNIWNSIVNTVTTVVSNIWNTIQNTFNNILDTIRNIMDNAKNAVSNAIDGILNFFTNMPSNILSALGDLGNLLVNAGKSIIDGLLRGLKNAATGLFDWVGGIASKILSLKGPLPYDRKLLIPAGEAIMAGLQEGLVDGFSDVESDVSKMGGEIADTFADNTTDIPINFDANVKNINGLGAMDEMVYKLGEMGDMAKKFNEGFNFNEDVAVKSTIDYDLLASKIAETFRNAPVQNNVDVVMEGGGVYLNTEQVGRQVAPVVSRVQARGASKK